MNDLLAYRSKPPRQNPEEGLQKAIWQHIVLLGNPKAIAYAVPNGEYRSKRTGARLKAQGVVAGVPDLAFVLPDGRAAFVELKRPGGTLSPAQKAFHAKCAAMDVPCAVIADIDTAVATLRGWGVLM